MAEKKDKKENIVSAARGTSEDKKKASKQFVPQGICRAGRSLKNLPSIMIFS